MFTLPANAITTVIGYMNGMITDTMPLLLLVLGITLALLIISRLTDNFDNQKDDNVK